MAFGSNHVIVGDAVTGGFVPELWSDEIIAAYKSNLVLANLVNKMPMKGKKGDTIHVPRPTRGTASAKSFSAQAMVTLQAHAGDELQIAIDKHYEYSRLIEDITDIQSMTSLRKFYTDDAGYSLAKQVDSDLFLLATDLDGNGVGTGAPADYVQSGKIFYANSAATAAGDLADFAEDTVDGTDVITDVTIRALIQLLDDADVPMTNRVMVIPPSAVNTIRGIDRYMSSDFVDGRGVQNGKIGTLYGVDIYVSTNCPEVESAVESTTVANKLGLIFHKEAFILAEQMGVRTQTQYKQEYLADLMTADTVYGTSVYRPEAAFGIVLPQ